jgi:outer membrane immunogenic protein
MQKLALRSAALVALLAGRAMAADMTPAPAYKAPAVMAPIFSWTGFYLGGNIGGAWGHGNISDSLFGSSFNNGSNNGVFIAGGQLGGNYQFGSFVVGVEGDFDWAANNNNTGGGVAISGVGLIQVSSNNRWMSTLAARFGFAVDRAILWQGGRRLGRQQQLHGHQRHKSSVIIWG